MNKEDVWKIINDKYPDGVHLTSRGTRTFFDTVWDAATNEQKRLFREVVEETDKDMPEFMREIFKGHT